RRQNTLKAEAVAALALFQLPPTPTADGMGIGILFEVLTAIVGPGVAQLALGGIGIFLCVAVLMALALLIALGLNTTGADKSEHQPGRQQAGDDRSHHRSSSKHLT